MARRAAVAILVCLAFVVAACNPSRDDAQPSGVVTAPPTEVRHDLEPLTKRFPAIGNPVDATWMSGTLGAQSDNRATAPGPSVYWIEAVIKLRPTTADALRQKFAPTSTGEVPDLNEGLRAHVPAGPFLTSIAMDTALSTDDWRSTAYLDSGSDTLVLRSVDD
ncbi:hypothetical protein A5733_11880 [Mycobacterium sp. NS-7484]|uniref:hypothetical protein n=1 Tax=Mycobacterium sp. NS-7484 TaxID=1834161 RepID=UPI00096F713D|nr:hypothetical protein [Mycobacterium sp. NS-7484]OMB96460.1 hypothetical protein A5733_11880 [Mycobacterium sp. NS-7484]